MRKILRIMSMSLTILFVMSMIVTGCGRSENPQNTTGGVTATDDSAENNGEKTAKIDLSKHADMVMYLIGEPAKDYDMMLEEANKLLAKDLNASITVNWIGWSDFGTQYPLVLASGEQIDVIYSSTWTNYYSNAQKGAFTALDELGPKYAPKSFASMSEDWIGQARVNGKIYALPASFYAYGDMGYIIRGDLMDKYGMKTIDGLDDYGTYLDDVVKNDTQLSPTDFNSSSDGLDGYYLEGLGYYQILQTQYSPYYVDLNKGDHKIINAYESVEGIVDYLKKMKEWSDKGYWSKSVLSNKDENMFRDGKAASRCHNTDSWRSAYMTHPEWDIRYFPNRRYTFKTKAMQDGMAIPASAIYPERGLMFIELLRNDERYYNLFTYGIEGTHYEITDEGMLKPLNIESWSPEGYCSWGFKSPEFYKPPVGTPPKYEEVMAKLEERSAEDPYVLFTPDFEPVKNEWAAVYNVIQQYRFPLSYGFTENVEADLESLVKKMKEAGSDIVMKEMQRQLDAYLETYGK